MKSGTQLGAYTIDRPLASGGMGSVYLATGPAGERVALKTVDTNSASHLGGLRREIRALLAVDHPSIVRVVAHGLYESLPWFAMEFIDGSPLREHFALSHETEIIDAVTLIHTPATAVQTNHFVRDWHQQPPAPDEQRVLLAHMAKVLRGLGHLHAAGLVHRDLKPDNIVVRNRDQEPVIVDFGIATTSAGADRERFTRVAIMAGTPSYIAPEQAQGLWSDARSDLYSVGCMLYEILTGHPPFIADSALQLIVAHVHHEVPRLPESMDPKLASLVYRLLEKRPEDRPGYGHDVARQIEEFLGVESPKDGAPIYLYRPAFSGRDEAMRQCVEALDELKAGHGGLTLVSGPSGSGKTRLAIELAAMVDADKMLDCVLIAITPGHLQNPFALILAEFADIAREKGPEFTQRVFAEDGALLAKVYPPILELPGMEGITPPIDLPPASEAMRRTKAWMSVSDRIFPERPVVLVLDEFEPQYVKYLKTYRAAHSIYPTPLWVFVTIDSAHESILSEFARKQIVTLPPLDRQSFQRLIQTALGMDGAPDAVTDIVESQADGNPATAMELVRAAVSEGCLARDKMGKWLVADLDLLLSRAKALDTGRLTRSRLSGFPESCRSLLQLMAVAQHPLTLSQVEELLADPDALDQALSLLLSEGVVEIKQDEIWIVDSQFRSVVVEQMPTGTATAVHEELARLMSRRLRPDFHEVGVYYHRAGNVAAAQEAFLWAADAARKLNHTSERWRCLRAYLDTEPEHGATRVEATVDYLVLSQRLGKMQELRGSIEPALAAAEALNRADFRARIMTMKAHSVATSDIEQAESILIEALKLAESCDDQLVLARVLNGYGNFLIRYGRALEAEAILARGCEASDGIDDSFLLASMTLNHAAALITVCRYDDAIDALNRAMEICRSVGLRALEAYGLGNLSIVAREYHEDLGESLRLILEARRAHREAFDTHGAAQASNNVVATLVLMGRYEEAVTEGKEALRQSIYAETAPTTITNIHMGLGQALAGTGRFEEARSVFEEGRRQSVGPLERMYLGVEAASMERRLGDLEASTDWLTWARDESWDAAGVRDKGSLLAAEAHLSLALGRHVEWPPALELREEEHVRAIERAIASQEPLLFGEVPDDALRAIPSLGRPKG